MSVNDPIGDMLTRIRNAILNGSSVVAMPNSKIKLEIARILKEEGYILNYSVIPGDVQSTLKIQLKYGPNNESVITGLKRVSKPGLRRYAKATGIPKVLNGLGVAIISTSRGVVTDKTARDLNTGGEIICEVW